MYKESSLREGEGKDDPKGIGPASSLWLITVVPYLVHGMVLPYRGPGRSHKGLFPTSLHSGRGHFGR